MSNNKLVTKATNIIYQVRLLQLGLHMQGHRGLMVYSKLGIGMKIPIS